MTQKILFLIFINILFFKNISAQDILNKNQKYKIQSLDEILHFAQILQSYHLQESPLPFLKDDTGKLTIEDISKSEIQSKFTLKTYHNHELEPFATYWLRLKVQNNTPQDEDWILSLGKVSNVEVYMPQNNGKYDLHITGQLVKTSQKTIKTGRYNIAEIFLPAQSGVKTLFIKFKNKINLAPDLNLKIIPKRHWQENAIWENLIQGFFQGLLWMMLFYNLLLFVTLADKTYIYYVLYIFTTSIYFLSFYGYISEFFLGEFPNFDFFYIPFSAHLGFLAYLFFMRNYLQTWREMPIWDIVIRIVSFVFGALLVALVVLVSISYSDYMQIERIFFGGIQAILLVMLLFILAMGERPARYFAIGTILMIGGGLLLFLGASGVLKLHNNIIYYQLGVIAQIFTFSLGLSERYRQMEDDKHNAQHNLIIQLQENDFLQQKVTSELEEKVKQRTIEISLKNDEIQAKSNEIQTKSDEINKKNIQVEKSHQEMRNSINYASRIQSSLFHDITHIEESFSEAFVFLRAKDIVSGDFYWFGEKNIFENNFNHQKNTNSKSQNNNNRLAQDFSKTNSIFPYQYKVENENPKNDLEYDPKIKILICADCTGHGVPGAFMTVMGYSILNEIINEKKIISPEKILYELDKKVIENLKKENREKQIQDGMEIAVLVYDEHKKEITYSGSGGHPLYRVRDFEIEFFSTSKHSIGFSSKTQQKSFEKITLEVKEDDIFYMASDGFQDQFGGNAEKSQKYMKKNMREFLLRTSHLPLSEQKQRIISELEKWQGNYHQTDDVLLVGIKV